MEIMLIGVNPVLITTNISTNAAEFKAYLEVAS